MTLPGILWVIGLIFVFVGEQIVGEGVSRLVVDGIGGALVLASLGLRARGLSATDASVRSGTLNGLIAAVAATSSLVLYALASTEVVNLLGLGDEARLRWQGVLWVLTPIVLVVGGAPMFFLDLVLSGNPVALPRDAARRALLSGLSAGIALSLVFPVNFLANHWNVDLDTAYFRTSRAGEATLAMARELQKPVKVFLFFPAGNDVLEQMRPYFDDLAAASQGQLTVEVHDQALSVALAEELKLQENGWVVFREEGATETVKFKMKLELDRAKRDLKKLDSLVQKNFLKATRGQRTAYVITGHGEGSHRTPDDEWRKIADLRKMLQDQSYKVEDLGLVQGLADKVPDDAELILLPAPTQPLLPEEVQSLKSWVDAGGQLLVFVEPKSDPLTDLLAHVGLQREDGPIADPQRRLRGQSPYLVLTDRYGTHPSVDTLSKAKQPVVVPAPVGLVETGASTAKKTVLLRTYGTAFSDKNTDGQQGADETSKVHNLAYAVEVGEKGRVVVVGNLGMFSDIAQVYGWRTNVVFALDAIRWMAGEESLAGETASEEDVKIDHSPAGQRWWFWGTIFAVPLLVLGGGLAWVTGRRRMR